eukprot:UN01338
MTPSSLDFIIQIEALPQELNMEEVALEQILRDWPKCVRKIPHGQQLQLLSRSHPCSDLCRQLQ